MSTKKKFKEIKKMLRKIIKNTEHKPKKIANGIYKSVRENFSKN